jgi:cytochrome c-type biogenesis protein CcmH/NrfG
MQQHEYQKAATRFRSLLTSFPAERPLMDRVRVYLDLCERELRRKPAPPETVEERLTSATAALNNGDEQTAEKLVKAVLKESPDHDLALYLLAAVRARLGDPGGALDLLRKAVQISPDISAQARHDADFEPLRRFAEFQQLLEHNGHNGHSNGRKARRNTAR